MINYHCFYSNQNYYFSNCLCCTVAVVVVAFVVAGAFVVVKIVIIILSLVVLSSVCIVLNDYQLSQRHQVDSPYANTVGTVTNVRVLIITIQFFFLGSAIYFERLIVYLFIFHLSSFKNVSSHPSQAVLNRVQAARNIWTLEMR